MIIESLSYLFHAPSCPEYVKKLGLLKELIAINSRVKRCNKDWEDHIAKTKNSIIKFSKNTNKDSKLLVLGAGLINDLPLEELSKSYQEIILADIFFLQGTIDAVRRYENVSFTEVDITAVLELSYKAYKQFKKDKDLSSLDSKIKNLSKHRSDFMIQEAGISHVISLNLLSQLPITVKDFFESKDIENGETFYKSLIENHIDYLKSFKSLGKKVLLITDTEKEVLDLNDRLKLSESSLEGYDLDDFNLEPQETWDWLLAPSGELDKRYSLKLKVSAVEL